MTKLKETINAKVYVKDYFTLNSQWHDESTPYANCFLLVKPMIELEFYTDIPFTEENKVTELNFGLVEAGWTNEPQFLYVRNNSDYKVINARLKAVYSPGQVGSYRDTIEQIYIASLGNGLSATDEVENAFLVCGIGTGANGQGGGNFRGRSYTRIALIYNPDYSTASGYKSFYISLVGSTYGTNRAKHYVDGNLHLTLTGLKNVPSNLYTNEATIKYVNGYLNTIGGS
mgnify:CR=1 FL=1